MVKRFLYDVKYQLWIRPSLWWKDSKVVLNAAFLGLLVIFYLIPRGYIMYKREKNEKIIDLRAGLFHLGRALSRIGAVLCRRYNDKEAA
jgi:hypothetical protein